MSIFETDQFGNKHWYDDDRRHHRDDGPAIIGKYGYKAWINHGKLHRLDGPAIEHRGTYKEYWVDGSPYKSLEDFLIKSMDRALQ